MIEKIEIMGKLIDGCALPGETKADGAFPGHINGAQVSRNRWLLLYTTRRWRFVDDNGSVVYQLREGTPDGRLIREGFLARQREDWTPPGRGGTMIKEHGHAGVFGVPRGALVRGERAPHANRFVAKWWVMGVKREKAHDGWRYTKDWTTMDTEWAQFRLNDREDDIEIVQPAQPLRQKGCTEAGTAGCARGGEALKRMCQSLIQAVPFNDDATEWADVNDFDGTRIAPLKYRFSSQSRLYEWVETGPSVTAGKGLFEASLLKANGGWLVAARKADSKAHGVVWLRAENPFDRLSEPVSPPSPSSRNAPLTAYCCADGVLRLIGGDPTLGSKRGRNPLRMWDIDPHSLSASNQRVIFDAMKQGLPIREEAVPIVDQAKLIPHSGGRVQYIVHRVRTMALDVPRPSVCANAEEKAAAGIYYEQITYAEDVSPLWQFGDGKE